MSKILIVEDEESNCRSGKRLSGTELVLRWKIANDGETGT